MNRAVSTRRRRVVPAGLTVVAAVVVIAIAMHSSIIQTHRVVAASKPSAPSTPSTNRVVSSSPAQTSAPTTQPTTPQTAPDALLANGKEGPRTAIPWSQVGAGWFVAEWAATPGLHPGQALPPGAMAPGQSPTTLYLVNPLGGRYAVATFPPSQASGPPSLADWSGDGRRALVTNQAGSKTVITEVDIASGATHSFEVIGSASASYSRPTGQAILVQHDNGGDASLDRVDLNGVRQLTFPAVLPGLGKLRDGLLATTDGTKLVMQAQGGLALVGNDGQFVRRLSVASVGSGCRPVGWWNADQVLASCSDTALPPQLWLVPLSGVAATALTRPPSSPGDNGDVSAWQVGGSTYVQALGACGLEYLAQLKPDGTTKPVNVPGIDNYDTVLVLGSDGPRLALRAVVGCGGGISLLWFDPVANTTTVLLGPPLNGGGVINAVLYRSPAR